MTVEILEWEVLVNMKYQKNGVYYVQGYDLVELSALINDSLVWEQLKFPREYYLALCCLIHNHIGGGAISASDPEKTQLIIGSKTKDGNRNIFREFVPFLKGKKAVKWLEAQEWIPDYNEFLEKDTDDLNSLIVNLEDNAYTRKREMEKMWEDGTDAIREAQNAPGVTSLEVRELAQCICKGLEDMYDKLVDSITSDYHCLSLRLGKIFREYDARMLV